MRNEQRWIVVALAAGMLAGAEARAGWFGPNEKDVKIEVEGPLKACQQYLWPDCRRVCFRITNHANKTLKRVEFDALGQTAGRSTRFSFRPYEGLGLSSDLIIQPHSSAVDCFEGHFEHQGGALSITVEPTDATFE